MQALLIANCVFNAFFSFTAITLNIVTIIALRKPLTIPRALKILLLSLAVSDLGVGLLVQPLYITRLVMMIKENTQTLYFEITLNCFYATAIFLTYASFFGVVALTTDRYLAAHFYLRYQELVTQRRVVAVVISNWILSAILMLPYVWIPSNFVAIIFVPVESVCYLTTALSYFKIYLAVRHHSNQIHVLQAQLAQNNEGDMANAARERKAAVGTFYVYLVFLICYLPSTCSLIIHRSAGPSTMLFQFGLYTNTLAYLNSSLNPTCQTHVPGLCITAIDQVRCFCSLDFMLTHWIDVPQFISQPSDLLLEDETCSTCYHGNTEKHFTIYKPVRE